MATHPIITFDSSSAKFVLDCFGKTIDDEKYVVEKDELDQRVLTPKGEEVRLKQFAGLRKGSVVFVKSDLDSLIEASDHVA